MGLSLQEQLLKAGLADKKQAKKANQEKRAKRKKNKGKTPPASKPNQAQLKAQAQADRSRELNRKINQEKQRLENKVQIRQLIEQNRLDLKKNEDTYYFKVGTKIKKLWVNEDITKKLSSGQLAIVTADGSYDIVPANIARQVADRDPEAVVLMHELGTDT